MYILTVLCSSLPLSLALRIKQNHVRLLKRLNSNKCSTSKEENGRVLECAIFSEGRSRHSSRKQPKFVKT
ncbi:hypothetical protein PUN28_005876 [Cardiocondyla obscurior]|uniref:Secreted protein n=1 Tax=Cardiocondyla obscurior TaxID=286306 RepID=A0AAW2G7V2_9HYME